MASTAPVPQPPSRFDRNTLVYLAGLACLFAGVAQEYSWGIALIVLGTLVTTVSIATSFFVTWLSVTAKEKK